MIFLRLLLNSALIFIIGEAFLTKKEIKVKNDSDSIIDSTNDSTIDSTIDLTIKFSLQHYVTPLHYDIHIELQQFFKVEPKNFFGKCVIYIKIDIPTSYITLHVQKPHIEIHNNIQLVDKNSKIWYKIYSTGIYKHIEENDIFVIIFREKILSGYYDLHVPFNGSLDDNEVFFKTSYKDIGQKMWIVATQAFAARQLFPCWDEPILKATFNISVKHHDSYKISSNMPVQNVVKENNEMQWTHFKITPTMSTYCIGFILHNFYLFPGVNLWCKSATYDLLFARNVIMNVTTYFENWEAFKEIPYIQHIAISGFRYNIYDMDKCNFIFYRETAIAYNEEIDSAGHKIEIARLIARKMTYQWLDNQINSPNLWLNQGIAMLLGTDIVNKSFSESRMTDLFVVQIKQESLRLDSDPHFYLPLSCYIKASAILHILQHILTNEKFRYGIEIFYNTSDTSTILNFWETMQMVYGISINIKEKLDPWTKLKHYPILMVRQKPNILKISIENIQSLDLDRELSILITITQERAPDFTISLDKPYSFWLSSLSSIAFNFLYDSNEWIIVNLQQIGYYRVNYETDNWLNIARYLNNITLYKKIHVLNRAQIIDDAYYFVKTGQINLSTFLNLTEYLSHESDYVAWYPMFKALEDMSIIFLFSNEEISHLKAHVAKSLYELLQRITYNETPNDNELIKCLRQEAAKWLCIFGHSNCKNAAEMKLNDYLKHNETNIILPWWKEWIYCNGLVRASISIWNKVSQTYTQKLDKKILKYLTYSQNPFIINHKMLTKVPKDHSEEIQHNDHIFYFHNIIEKHARDETILTHILQNFMNVKPKQFNTIAALIHIINHIYTVDVFITIIPFLEKNLIERELIINAKVDLFNSEINSLNKCLKSLIKKRISFVHHKIKLRLSQIENQISRFHFIKNGKEVLFLDKYICNERNDMAFLQVIVNSVLILIRETERPLINNNGINNTNLTTEYSLPDYIRPIHYMLNIQFFNEEINNFSGDSTVYIKIEQPTWNISLHAQLLQIKIKNINFLKKQPFDNYYAPTDNITLTYSNESNILIFQFSKELSEGSYVLEMEFDTILHDGENIFKTFLTNENGYTSWFLATSFQAIGARQLFPCWDDPKFKSVFSINIKHHRLYIALSNMPENLNQTEITVMKWTHFNLTSMIPTYLVAFLVTSNDAYEVTKLPKEIIPNEIIPNEINIWCRANLVPHIQFAKSVIADVISFFDENMVAKEHLEEMLTMQHVLIPNLPHNSIKKWKLIFYRETSVVYDNEVDSITHKIGIAHLITREMVHQWLNIRMNSSSWWSYHWLYEGLATLFGTDIINQIYPESRMSELYVVQMQQESLRLDTHSIMEPLTSTIFKSSEINSLFSFSYYIKAPNIMRMLRYFLTDDVFHEGLEIFFKKQSATLDDFWDAMQTAYNKTQIAIRKFNIKEKLNPWALQKHYPVLEVREQDDRYLNISISNIDSLELNIKWWIPLTIAVENHPDSISQWYIGDYRWITLSGAKLLFPHQLEEWIIVNLQQTGYYRVNYEASNWLKIAKYLQNKNNFTNIHVLNRAQIIDDAYHFTMNGQLDSSIFFELIKYLSQEKDYVAWYPMFKALEDISTILQFPGKKIDELKTSLMSNLYELLLKIKYDESSQDDDLTKCLRYEAAKWLCLLGDTECRMIANSKLKKHLANSTETKLFQEWKDWIYCNGLTAPNSHLTWDAIWQTYTWKLDRKLLKFLCCSTNVFTIKYKILASVPVDLHKQIQDIDHLYYFHNIIEMHAKHNEVLNYILTKFVDLKPKQLSAMAVLIDLINHVYSEEQLEMIKEFVEQIKVEITFIPEYDIITQDEINECMANVVKQYISKIHHKIQQRRYQITNQKYRFRHLLST
ncbi:uncharacterized protein LOC126850576 [Cataglyphis hispanica]|uniref:uncharacterized protein LOC126850576 n=1 Tax=Cataglyphis hispanica TaxID=1086592 RepID=UPI0021806DAC|nr:uncharacterized protein LOC126850576 [Cataglyphis hispanica]